MKATHVRATLVGALILVACGGPQDPAEEDLTAAEHEEQAAREEQEAEEHEDRYDPGARTTAGGAATETFYGLDVYNPTEVHLTEAEEHRAHAQAHREMAEALRAYEELECGRFPPGARAACPLLLGLESVEDIEGGVQMTFAEGANLEPVLDHIRCHIAFAAAQGTEGIEHCALYVHGAQVAVDGRVVILTTTEEDHVAELRERVRIQAP
jgi:hypothetical protein